jgi:hypothetical protein
MAHIQDWAPMLIMGVVLHHIGLNLRSKNQGSLDSNVMNKGTREQAGYNHETKSQCVGCIDKVRLLCAAAAQRIHCTPYAGRREIAKPKNSHVVKRRPKPSHCMMMLGEAVDSMGNPHTFALARSQRYIGQLL